MSSFQPNHAGFPKKLHDMLDAAESCGYQHVVAWLPCGNAFQIYDSEALLPILRVYFNQTKFKSFLRQLQNYGFNRETKGPQKGVVRHRLFLRGRRDLCQDIRRISKSNSAPELSPTNALKGVQQSMNGGLNASFPSCNDNAEACSKQNLSSSFPSVNNPGPTPNTYLSGGEAPMNVDNFSSSFPSINNAPPGAGRPTLHRDDSWLDTLLESDLMDMVDNDVVPTCTEPLPLAPYQQQQQQHFMVDHLEPLPILSASMDIISVDRRQEDVYAMEKLSAFHVVRNDAHAYHRQT